MRKHDIFLGATLMSVIVSVWMLWPFGDAILWAFFTAYFAHYFADHLDNHIHNRRITTGIMLLLLAGFVGAVSFVAITSMNAEQVQYMTTQFSTIMSGIVDQFVATFDLPQTIGEDLKHTISGFTALSSERLLSIISRIPWLLINLLVYLVVAAFLIKDGKDLKDDLFATVDALPEEYSDIVESVVWSIDGLFRGVFLTYLIVAVIVGSLTVAGLEAISMFTGTHISFIWGWGLIIAVFAFLPVVSAPMVYVTLSLLYLSQDQITTAAAIFLYGVVVLNALPEILLRPYLASHETHEHPMLLFVGFLIGPLVLGFKGIILGPMILVVTKNLLTMTYIDE